MVDETWRRHIYPSFFFFCSSCVFAATSCQHIHTYTSARVNSQINLQTLSLALLRRELQARTPVSTTREQLAARSRGRGHESEFVEVFWKRDVCVIPAWNKGSSRMVVALEHRHDRNEDQDEEAYSGGSSGDVPGMDVVSAGSVTSFVRKLFQMVQGECDSIVGFVAGE